MLPNNVDIYHDNHIINLVSKYGHHNKHNNQHIEHINHQHCKQHEYVNYDDIQFIVIQHDDHTHDNDDDMQGKG